jgi:flagellar biosynthesis chaperone FliJ
MAASRALKRLLRIRDLQEEQSRLALESALGDLNRLESALTATVQRGQRGRQLYQTSACSGELPDRLAGIEETHTSERYTAVLVPRIAAKKTDITELRQEYLNKRIERRQAETLIEEAMALEAVEAGRRGQAALDDWYSSSQYRIQLQANADHPEESGDLASSFSTRESETEAKKTLVDNSL